MVRQTLTWLALIAIIGFTISQTWKRDPSQGTESISQTLSQVSMNWFAKIVVGGDLIASNAAKKAAELEGTANETPSPTPPFGSQLLNNLDLQQISGANKDQLGVYEARLIVAGYLGYQEEIKESLKLVQNNPYSALFNFVYENGPKQIEPDWQLVANELNLGSFVLELFKINFNKKIDPNCCQDRQMQINKVASLALVYFGLSCIILILAGLIGFIFLIMLIALIVKGKLNFAYKPIANPILLESFILYLLYMNVIFYFGSEITSFIGLASDAKSKVFMNCIFITLAATLLAFPLLRGTKWQALTKQVGLYLGDIPTIFTNILIAPLIYFAAWTPFLIFSLFYQTLLGALDVDMVSGTHPIVPILLNPKADSIIPWMIILAVVIVPIIEELYFRGFLYGHLRSFIGPKSSMFISGLVFALVHPQGAIGVLPLALIGAGLAFIREWRGSLLPCIITHGCVNGTVFLFLLQLR